MLERAPYFSRTSIVRAVAKRMHCRHPASSVCDDVGSPLEESSEVNDMHERPRVNDVTQIGRASCRERV